MADRNATLRANLVAQDQMSQTLNKVGANTDRLSKQFTKLSGAVQNAFQFYVRYRIFGLINRGISAIENAIPGLVARGQEWAQTVDSIADSSGLAAEKASLLAGVVTVMTGDAEGLTKALGALSQQVVNHGDVLERYGIQTRNANGQLLDTWTILGNVRRATNDLGNGFITTAAARDLFSRGGQTLMDFLTMSDEQFRMLTRDVKASGVIMSEAGRIAADQWGRTYQRFEQQITGIANQIVQGVQPLLSRLVDGITNYIRQNMASIVGFVVGAISFVAGAIAGFLGIDISGQVKTFAEAMDDAADKTNKRERQLSKAAKTRDQQTSTEDAYTQALNSQIDAIDRQLAAMSRSDDAAEARREHAELLKDISDAQKELRDLRGESVFAAGMSAAEAELARQAHAADIVDAQKRVHESQQRLAEQERKTQRDNLRNELQDRKAALQERLADHIKTLAEEAKADREVLSQILGADKGGIGALPANIANKVNKAVREGLTQADAGTQWGQQFRTAVEGFFDDITDPTTGLGSAFANLASVATLVADNWKIVAGAGAVLVASNLVGSLAGLARGLPAIVGFLGPQGLFLGALALGGLAVTMWADSIFKWLGIIDEQRSAYQNTVTDPIGKKIENVEKQINMRGELRNGPLFGFGMGIFGTAHKGNEEEALARSIANALKDPTVTKVDLATYAKKVDELVTLMESEGRGGEWWDKLLEQQQLLREAVGEESPLATSAAALTAAVSEGGPIATSQSAIAEALGEEGPMAALAMTSGTTRNYLAPAGGRTLAQHMNQVAYNTRGLNTTLPWGIANITLNIDGKTAARLAGVPVRRGTSTTRILGGST